MTYWYETPTDLKDARHWMGVAIDLAYTIGLQMNVENSKMAIKRRFLLKRIWWSCFTRDALMSLGTRRPLRIANRESYNVPMLDVEDFPTESFETKALSELFPSCVFVHDGALRRQLAVMCIEHTKLCVCISEILTTQYALSDADHALLDQADGDSTASVSLFPRSMDSEVSRDARNCDSRLNSWLAGLPAEAAYKPMSRSIDTVQDIRLPVDLHLATLHLVYWTTLIALHRPHSIGSQYHPWPAPSSIVEDAALTIGNIITNLQSVDMVRNLPPISVTVLMTAVIYSLLGINSREKDKQQRSIDSFFCCMQALQCLRDSVPIADAGASLLEAAIKKSDVSIPLSSSQDWRNFTPVAPHDSDAFSADGPNTSKARSPFLPQDMSTKVPPFSSTSVIEQLSPNNHPIVVNLPPRTLRFGGDGWLGRQADWKNSSLWEEAVTSEWFNFISLEGTAWE